MTVLISAVVLFIISAILAIRSVKKELSVPDEIKDMRVRRRIGHPFSGTIVFFKEKIVHYSSVEPASDSEERDS